MENNGEMNLLMSKKQHVSWGHHMSRSSLGPFFFIQQNQHHSVTKVCIILAIVQVSLLSLFLEHDLHCFVLSGFSVNHSSTTTNWVAGILCKVF